MAKKYRDELLDMKFSIEMMDGIKPQKTFFAITEDSLKNTFHVVKKEDHWSYSNSYIA